MRLAWRAVPRGVGDRPARCSPRRNLAAGETVIANLAAAVQRRVRSTSPEALLAHLHDVLFDVIGFRGNRDDYYNPGNSLLPDVLRTRRGLPITLTLVYRCVAAGVGITVHGVNAPGHFLAEVELDEGGVPTTCVRRPLLRRRLAPRGRGAGAHRRGDRARGDAVGRRACSGRRREQWLARMLRNLQAALAACGRERDMFAMQELEQLA